ncbi:hypothetical protein [Maridesulfovibrio sp.]|uniref:hypothetical protein n=1 Tax=Maridesulfovibrio sp. TaxID=2795000 RepID=UPI0029CA15C1|nr:hypothetical protein [Maridesulfovibrio sp.]
MIDVSSMTHAEKIKMAADLAPYIVAEIHDNPTMIKPGTGVVVKTSIRIVDSGKISSHTHEELAAAEAALDSATTIAAMKAAMKGVIKVFKMVIMGKASVENS